MGRGGVRGPTGPAPRHRRILPWVFVVVLLAIAAGATMPFYPLYHVPWFLFAVVAFFLWRRASGHRHQHQHHHPDGGRPSSVMDH